MNQQNIPYKELLHAITDTSIDLIAVVDTAYFFTFFNLAYAKDFKKNFGADIKIGDHLPSLMEGVAQPPLNVMIGWTQALKGEENVIIYELLERGNVKSYEATFKPLYDNEQKLSGALQLVKEVTDLMQLQREAAVNKNFYTMANALPQIVWTATPDGLLDYFNDQWYKYSGMTYYTSIGVGWATAVHEQDLQTLTNIWTHCLETKENYYVQARVKAATGIYRWLLIRALPFYNENGEVVNWFGTCTDIEEQKVSEFQLQHISQELIKANEQIQLRNERLTRINADLDNFVYTASHDLKSPINNIESLVNSLYENINAEAPNKSESILLLKFIDQSVERFKNTINELTEVAKVQNEEIEDEEEISFEELVKEVLQSLNGLITKFNAKISIDFSHAPRIKFSIKNLRSISYNLISNAIKYSAPGRQPEISIYTLKESQHVVLGVQDNGLGIKEQDKEKVFKIFKRLHLHVEGSGVGMAIVKKIVDNNGGRIEIESEVGKGTLFKIFLSQPMINLN